MVETEREGLRGGLGEGLRETKRGTERETGKETERERKGEGLREREIQGREREKRETEPPVGWMVLGVVYLLCDMAKGLVVLLVGGLGLRGMHRAVCHPR